MKEKMPEAIIGSLLPEIIGIREELHAHPELSWQEHETTARIEQFLSRHGLEGFRRVGETGGYLDLVWEPAAPMVLLRADIDALPIKDEKQVSYRSTVEGVCHACAHDAHTAVVLGTALALRSSTGHPPVNLRCVFQPAEEPIPSGAPVMIEQGILDGVSAALGMHMEPRLPLNTVCITEGWVNMQSVRLELELGGPGGHSARPAETADLLWIASRIIQEGYQLVYRRIDHRDSPVVLTFTEINAGQGYNVIPSHLSLTGTLRTSEPAKKELALERLRNLIDHIAEDGGCDIGFTSSEGAPAIYNDPNLAGQLCRNLEEGFGAKVVLDRSFRTPGADDFSHYLKHVPGVMVRFGIRTRPDQPGLHEGSFDVPREVFKTAISFFVHQLRHLQL